MINILSLAIFLRHRCRPYPYICIGRRRIKPDEKMCAYGSVGGGLVRSRARCSACSPPQASYTLSVLPPRFLVGIHAIANAIIAVAAIRQHNICISALIPAKDGGVQFGTVLLTCVKDLQGSSMPNLVALLVLQRSKLAFILLCGTILHSPLPFLGLERLLQCKFRVKDKMQVHADQCTIQWEVLTWLTTVTVTLPSFTNCSFRHLFRRSFIHCAVSLCIRSSPILPMAASNSALSSY